MLIAIKCVTKNDVNGNPRRGWLIMDAVNGLGDPEEQGEA